MAFRHRRPRPRQQSEAKAFAAALRRLRREMKWTQSMVGDRLGVSRRTIGNWECAYWLPPHKQRVQVVLSLKQAPPEHVLTVADALGVSSDPRARFLLQEFELALEEGDGEVAPVPPTPRPSAEALRAATDAVVREMADRIDARPSDVRQAIARALSACAALGATLEEALAAVEVRAPAKPPG